MIKMHYRVCYLLDFDPQARFALGHFGVYNLYKKRILNKLQQVLQVSCLCFFEKKQSDWIKNSIVTSRDSLKSCDEHITIRLVIFRYYSFYNFFFREIFDLKFIPYGFCYYYVPTMLALLTNLPINLNLLRLKMISFLYIASNSHG